MLNLREKDKETICNIASRSFSSIVEILAYGSRVNGDNHDASDLDLVVRTKDQKKLEVGELIKFKDELQNSNIPILVQVMDWARIPKSFHQNILRSNEILYSNYE